MTKVYTLLCFDYQLVIVAFLLKIGSVHPLLIAWAVLSA